MAIYRCLEFRFSNDNRNNIIVILRAANPQLSDMKAKSIIKRIERFASEYRAYEVYKADGGSAAEDLKRLKAAVECMNAALDIGRAAKDKLNESLMEMAQKDNKPELLRALIELDGISNEPGAMFDHYCFHRINSRIKKDLAALDIQLNNINMKKGAPQKIGPNPNRRLQIIWNEAIGQASQRRKRYKMMADVNPDAEKTNTRFGSFFDSVMAAIKLQN